MGIYYHYVNLSKKERFAIDSLGGNNKHSGLSYTLAARAFHLMLDNAGGRWAGDSIAIMGDDITPEWDRITEEFVDIEADAILAVFHADGFEGIRESATRDDNFFMQLCHMVVSRQALEMESALHEMCGGSYHKRYAQLCQERPSFRSKNIASAGRH